MITREYKCPVHGIVEQICHIEDDTLKVCPEENCMQPVTRHFEATAHSWKCDGFAGKGFATNGKKEATS